MYLLFTLEKIDLWEELSQKLANTVIHKIADEVDTITVPLGKHVSIRFISGNKSQLSKPPSGRGYKVESVSREAALDVASKLEPVEGAQKSPLEK